jgi:hypothetical protein
MMVVARNALLAAVAVSGILVISAGTAQANTHTCTSGTSCSFIPSGTEGGGVGTITTDDSSRSTTTIKIGAVGVFGDAFNTIRATGTGSSTSQASVQGAGSSLNSVTSYATNGGTAKAQAGSLTPVSVGLAAPPAGSIVFGVLPTTEPASAAVSTTVSASGTNGGFAEATTLGVSSSAISSADGLQSFANAIGYNGGIANAQAANGSATRLASATAVASDGAVASATATRTGGSGAIANASGQGVSANAVDTDGIRSATVSGQTGNTGNTCGIGGGGHAFARVVDGGGSQFSSC